MAVYQGGKARLGKKIHDMILDIEDEFGEIDLPYFEPFVGMCGVMRHFGEDVVDGYSDRKLYASDINKDIISMWKSVQTNKFKFPRSCSRAIYDRYRNSRRSPSLRGFI